MANTSMFLVVRQENKLILCLYVQSSFGVKIHFNCIEHLLDKCSAFSMLVKLMFGIFLIDKSKKMPENISFEKSYVTDYL